MLIEIHMIQNHVPSNLNRDDTGSPKTCMFGGIRRARISSQCIKRSIRQSSIFKDEMEKIGLSFRTRLLPEEVKKQLIEQGIPEDHAQIVGQTISGMGAKKVRSDEKLATKQIMFFSAAELKNIADIFVGKIKGAKNPEEVKKRLEKFDYEATVEKSGHQPITPDIALFGRMITSKAFADIEASIQVAHALSTNKLEHEFDYFTAVDDLIGTSESIEQQGAGMIGDVEYNSSCYYKYFSLDYDGFIDNMTLSDKKTILKSHLNEVVIAFLKAAVFTTPSGKQNSFAAHQLPEMILIELRQEKIPVSYANAFIQPSAPKGQTDLLEDTLEKFTKYVGNINEKYGLTPISRLWFNTRNISMKGVTVCNNFETLSSKLKEQLPK
jgi:CRISPR system Cascade subunit CasC